MYNNKEITLGQKREFFTPFDGNKEVERKLIDAIDSTCAEQEMRLNNMINAS